ncbi:MAG TPA: cytochrome b/b6 domain-containing protein [Ramlibacter sp.]|jgi:thiosulfate reductase cytochrome b subunit|nr:cytochrome b/b6 domain-containing protein [Ramlibacter sp.]
MDPDVIYRHRLPVRVMHWINVICLFVLLGSGLQIFNAHPALYWGADSRDATLLLQLSKFPHWATIPGPQWLALGRVWHFFFAWIFFINGIAYVLWTIFSGHLRRDLVPTGGEWRGIGRSIKDHLVLKHPHGDEAKRYNVLQNIAYLSMIFIVLPMIVIGGWALSPMMDSFAPGWVDWFGGRQALRTLHFAAAVLIVAFFLVHVFEVIVTGLVNNLRSMVTGHWRVPK